MGKRVLDLDQAPDAVGLKLYGVQADAYDRMVPAGTAHGIATLDGNAQVPPEQLAGGTVADHAAAADPHPQYYNLTRLNAKLALKVDLASIGMANGVAGLDASGKVPASQLPGFVDDVIEVANLAALPNPGTAGLLYVTLDTNRAWRWGGSGYFEISPSPGSTDAVPEGATNKYYTTARAKADAVANTIGAATDVAPSQAAVAAALAGKSAVGHTHAATDIVSGTLDDLRLPSTMSTKTMTGAIVVQAVAGQNAHNWFRDDTAKARGLVFWNRAADTLNVRHYATDGVTPDGEVIIGAATFTFNGNAIFHAGNKPTFAQILSTPTTLAGYGITDAEPLVAAGTTAQYRRGDKSWFDFATSVRASTLTGYAIGSNAALAATDTVLGAFGKLEAKVNAKANSATTVAGYGITDAVTTAQVGAANGVASLDATGKVPSAQLPGSVGANIDDAIVDAVTNRAPSQNAVFDALALKAAKSGDTFSGTVTVQVNSGSAVLVKDTAATPHRFGIGNSLNTANDGIAFLWNYDNTDLAFGTNGVQRGAVKSTGALNWTYELQSTSANAWRAVQGNYGVIARNDGSDFYLLATASADQYGAWSALRPFAFNLSTGKVTIGNGVAVTGGRTEASGRLFVTDSAGVNPGSPAGKTIQMYYMSTAVGDWGTLLTYDYAASAYKPLRFEASGFTFAPNGTPKLSIDANGSLIGRDLTADRGDGTGVVFLNNAQNKYVYWTGAQYSMPGGRIGLDSSSVGAIPSYGGYHGLAYDTGGYLIMYGTADATTYVGAKTGAPIYLRPNGNDSNAEVRVVSDGFYTTKPHYKLNANGTAWTAQPRVFVQSADPGAAAADGDLWIW